MEDIRELAKRHEKNVWRLFNMYEGSIPILYYDYFHKLERGKWIEISPGVTCRISDHKKGIYIETIFANPGATLSTHMHDCREDMDIVEGFFVDEETGKRYAPGDGVVFNVLEAHAIRAIKPGKVNILFHKPLKSKP